MNQVYYFEIQASEPTKLVEFYKNIFGWSFTKDDNVPIEYYRIATEGINGGLLKRPAKTPPQMFGTNAFTCSIEVDDFDKAAKTILDNGGIVALDKFAVPGVCWQGYFVDPDNNTFGLFEANENAK